VANTLTAGLKAAQEAVKRLPDVLVTISDRIPGGTRGLRPAAWYDGAEAAGPHAAVCASDGSLTRLRVDGTTLYRSRVTTPDSGDTYSSWTSFRTGTRLCAIASTGAFIFAFAVDDATPTQIYSAQSIDSGATWGAWSLVITHSATVSHIAAAIRSGEQVVIVNTGANLSAYVATGGAYGAAVTSTDGLITPTGLAVHGQDDYNVIVTGTLADATAVVAARIFGDGVWQGNDTWSAPVTIVSAGPASGVAYSYPSMTREQATRISFRENYTGTGAYARIMLSFLPSAAVFSEHRWKEPYPLDFDDAYGLALSDNTTHLFLTTSSDVLANVIAASSYDVSADVLMIDQPMAAFLAAPTTIVLDNTAGTYNAPGAGAVAVIQPGAEIDISFGLTVSGAADRESFPSVWVESIARVTKADGSKHLVLTAHNVFGILAAHRAPRAVLYSGETPFTIALKECGRAGVDFSSVSTSPPAVAETPPLLVTAGTSALATLRRLFDRIDDTLIQRTATLLMAYPDPADITNDWAFQFNGTDHPIGTVATYTQHQPIANHVRVIGGAAGTVIGEAIDYASVLDAPGAPLIIADRDLTTAAAALARAESRQHAMDRRVLPIAPPAPEPDRPQDTPRPITDSPAAALAVPLHHGIEINDIVELTDSRYSIAADYRIIGIRSLYDRRSKAAARYDQQVEFGAV